MSQTLSLHISPCASSTTRDAAAGYARASARALDRDGRSVDDELHRRRQAVAGPREVVADGAVEDAQGALELLSHERRGACGPCVVAPGASAHPWWTQSC